MRQPLAISLPLVWVGMSLAGFAPLSHANEPPPGLKAERCNPGICELRVTVSDCRSATGITVDKPLVEVSSATNMRWTIVTPGFEFASDGIRFEPANAQFRAQHSPRPNEFRVQNEKLRNGDFYYFIHVKGCTVADPWVRNTQ